MADVQTEAEKPVTRSAKRQHESTTEALEGPIMEGPVNRAAKRRQITHVEPPTGTWICSTDATSGSVTSASLVQEQVE